MSTVSNFAVEGTATFEPQQAPPVKPGQPSRIILLVEATAQAATNNKTARKWIDVLLKRIDADARGSDASNSTVSQNSMQQPAEDMPKIQYGLIVYGTWDRSTQAPIQFSSWCSSLTELFEWLNGVQFVGGSPNKGTALTEALAQAIVMSKCPYPDGSRPAAAGPTHPQPGSAAESGLTAHTHAWLVCSSFSPCRLPIPWACEADTKAALSSTFYPAALERFDTMIQQLRVSQSQSGSSSVFSNFDSIKQSLQPPITPGTADIWDITFSFARHRLSLSILSGMHKHSSRTPGGEQYRGCVELFCYANACLTINQLKQACRVGLMGWQVAQAALLMSPLHIEASRAGLQYVSKLIAARNAKNQQQQQQQSQQAGQQQGSQSTQPGQQPAAGTPPQQGAAAAGTQQAPGQAQQQQQQAQQQQPQAQGQTQLTPQQQQHLAAAMLQRQQAQQAQQQQQLQQAQIQARQQQQQQAQAQAAQQQQQPQQQTGWMQAAHAAAGVRPQPQSVQQVQQAMQQQAQQQQQAAQAAANRQQQQAQQQQQQQVQAGMLSQQQAMLLQQQQQQQQAQQKQQAAHQQGMQAQQQQQQQQLQAAARYSVTLAGVGGGQVPGVVIVGQQQPQQVQQQLAGMGAQMVSQGQVFVQSQPQQMLLQQQNMALGGYMQQQALPGMQQQMLGVGVNVQQQQQLPMQAQAAAAGGGGKQRSAFWQGTLSFEQPGYQRTSMAEVELLSSNAPAMAGLFANRGNQIVSRRILTQSDFRQLTQSRGQGVKVTKGSFKVLAPSNLWSWLQGQVHSRPDKQVMLEGVIQDITTVFIFGNQETKGQPTTTASLNMMEGNVIFCVPT